MHRDNVDDAVTYMPDDLVLFRESPFAAWMERLTLENPDHGILPDAGAPAPQPHSETVDDIVATLRAEGRNVAVIDSAQTSFERREDTLSAMRSGADFIAGGYLQQGQIAANAGLLMRTSGFSSLGNFLYIPCEARPADTRYSPFRLCVLAELLLSIQKQLPPQLLVISGSAELTPLQTEDHIYYYRAVLARFMDAMTNFRKHKMPDPSESAFFGRWSECASEVLKQRAQRDDAPDYEESEVIEEIIVELPRAQAVGASPSHALDDPRGYLADQAPMLAGSDTPTLVEQASRLAPGTYGSGVAPGHTPNLARIAPLRPVPPVAPQPEPEAESLELEIVDDEPPARRGSDVALENLQFIGSAPESLLGPEPLVEVTAPRQRAAAPTALEEPQSRESFSPESPWPEREREQEHNPQRDRELDRLQQASGAREPLPELEPRDPVLLPPEPDLADAARFRPVAKPHPLDSESDARTDFIDMDGAPPPSLSPLAGGEAAVDEQSVLSAIERLRSNRELAARPGGRQISDSLITGEEFEDSDEP